MESPVGQFLSQILATHPHLLPAAAEQQLEQLQTDRDAAKDNGGDKPAPSDGDIVLYRYTLLSFVCLFVPLQWWLPCHFL